MTKLSIDELKKLLRYERDTGHFYWKVDRGRIKAGTRAGAITVSKRGYVMEQIRVNYHSYLAHRLAWAFMRNEWPEHFIDHVDGDSGNNKWSNLRRSKETSRGAW